MSALHKAMAKAANEGQDAAWDINLTASDCPYPMSSVLASEWLRAFQDELLVIERLYRERRNAA